MSTNEMPSRLKQVSRIVARGLMLAFGLLGGLAWALCICLLLAFLYRISWFSLAAMVVTMGACIAAFALAGLLWSRRFMCYALPVLETVFADENATTGLKFSVEEVLVIVGLVVAVAGLTLAVLLKSVVAACVGMVAFSVYALRAPVVFGKRSGC